MSEKPSIQVSGVDINWGPEKGCFSFFGLPAALFWINPSLLTMLRPLADEVGHNLFRLQVASSASLGTEEDYHNMVTVLGSHFEEGFHKWGAAVSAAGWGTFKIMAFDEQKKTARVRVQNTWELLMQQDLSQRWGCPFIQGKIIGIFNQALLTNCWADEVSISYAPENPYVEFDIYQSTKTISLEIEKERRLRMQEKETLLAKEIDKKTNELNLEKIRAESANHSKSKFLTAMGHELRTPLNAVLGFSQLLAKDELSERQSIAVKQIMDAGQNMLKLVEQVLNFSKVGVESKTVETIAINSQLSLISALDLVGTMAQRRCINLIDLTKNSEAVIIIANEAYFIEILLSFITNAISYIPENGTVKISSFTVEGNRQRFMISDNGPGIEEQNKEKLFEPFERLKHETGPISGAGVGLSIARIMAKNMDGDVGFKNNEEGGASFWVDLPILVKK
ncbi:MAG: HAMP domain-containing sensor histidine kinase [Bermanella sp.]